MIYLKRIFSMLIVGPFRWLIKHWLGEYSLAVGFLLNFIPVLILDFLYLLCFIYSGIVLFMGHLSADGIAKYSINASVFLISVASFVWWCVGMWRAAGLRAKDGRGRWLALGVKMIIIGLIVVYLIEISMINLSFYVIKGVASN
jgi:hypothetical protein